MKDTSKKLNDSMEKKNPIARLKLSAIFFQTIVLSSKRTDSRLLQRY